MEIFAYVLFFFLSTYGCLCSDQNNDQSQADGPEIHEINIPCGQEKNLPPSKCYHLDSECPANSQRLKDLALLDELESYMCKYKLMAGTASLQSCERHYPDEYNTVLAQSTTQTYFDFDVPNVSPDSASDSMTTEQFDEFEEANHEPNELNSDFPEQEIVQEHTNTPMGPCPIQHYTELENSYAELIERGQSALKAIYATPENSSFTVYSFGMAKDALGQMCENVDVAKYKKYASNVIEKMNLDEKPVSLDIVEEFIKEKTQNEDLVNKIDDLNIKNAELKKEIAKVKEENLRLSYEKNDMEKTPEPLPSTNLSDSKGAEEKDENGDIRSTTAFGSKWTVASLAIAASSVMIFF